MAKSPKTFLISGGAGFVGSHLTDKLVSEGHKVIIIDDLSNGSKDNIKHHGNNITFIEGDITEDFKKLTKRFSHYSLDGIFHLACFPRSMSLENPQRDAEVNALGTLHMLQLAQKHGCKLVFTSNSGILGDPQYLPLDEKHPDNPTTPYDANKLVGEYYCKIYYRIHKVPVGMCRLATVYGDRQRTKPGWKPLISEFVDKLKKNEAPVITWDGEQTRDFIYVKDIVQGLVKAFFGETKDEYYLLGTNTETSVNLLFNMVSKILKKNIQPIRKPQVAGDIRRMKISYAKAKATFGFEPKYTLEEGITNYIEWFTKSTKEKTSSHVYHS